MPIAAKALAVTYLLAATAGAEVVEGPVGRDAGRGDPARWDEPADTPRKQYDNAMQEADAALAEALKECRSGRGDARGPCEAEARARHEDDVERARGHLVRSNLG